MKIKYTIQKPKVKMGSAFSIIGDTLYTRNTKGWKVDNQDVYCSQTDIIDKHYLKGTYKIIK